MGKKYIYAVVDVAKNKVEYMSYHLLPAYKERIFLQERKGRLMHIVKWKMVDTEVREV